MQIILSVVAIQRMNCKVPTHLLLSMAQVQVVEILDFTGERGKKKRGKM